MYIVEDNKLNIRYNKTLIESLNLSIFLFVSWDSHLNLLLIK